MLRNIACHHIDAALGFVKENHEEIKKRYNLRGIKLDAGNYKRESPDVVGIFKIMESERVKPEGRRRIIQEYKGVRG